MHTIDDDAESGRRKKNLKNREIMNKIRVY